MELFAVPWSFFWENVLTALLIIAYIALELRMGRGKQLTEQIGSLIAIVIAMAEENPEMDEDAVRSEFNGHTPDSYKTKEER